MLFLPWRNEESFYCSFKTYEEHFKAKKALITPVRKSINNIMMFRKKLLKKLNKRS